MLLELHFIMNIEKQKVERIVLMKLKKLLLTSVLVLSCSGPSYAQSDQEQKVLINSYLTSIEQNPYNFNFYVELAHLYSVRGEVDKAIKIYQSAYKINNQNPILFYNLGILLYKKGRWNGALTSLRRAIRLNPSFAEAYHNSGTIYFYQGKLPEALAYFKTAQQLSPEDKAIQYDIQKTVRALAIKLNIIPQSIPKPMPSSPKAFQNPVSPKTDGKDFPYEVHLRNGLKYKANGQCGLAKEEFMKACKKGSYVSCLLTCP